MKNLILQLSITLFAFTALTFLVSYTRPAADEAKEYIVVREIGPKIEKGVTQKLSEGWHLQGGVSVGTNGVFCQAMVK